MSTDSYEGEAFAFGTGPHGKRPTYILTRRVDDGPSLTLYELVQEEIAIARQERFDRSVQSKDIRTYTLSHAIVGGEVPEDLADRDDVTERDWEGWTAIEVAELDRERFEEARRLTRSVMKDAELDHETVCSGGVGSAALIEGEGIRLATAYTALRRVRRRDRMRAIVNGVDRMSQGECYYWHAKIRSPRCPNGAKALRTLLSAHIN